MTSSLARIRPTLRRAAFVAALGAFMVPATAGAAVHAQASATKKAKPPVVTRVTPMKVEIGQKLEIRGRYFLRGRNKNTVVFKRSGGKAVFVKADVGTTKLLRLTVPSKLEKEFVKNGLAPQPTRFRIRDPRQEVRQALHHVLALAARLPALDAAAPGLRGVPARR